MKASEKLGFYSRDGYAALLTNLQVILNLNCNLDGNSYCPPSLTHTLQSWSSDSIISFEPHLQFHSRFVLLKDSSHTVSHTHSLSATHTHTPKLLPLFLAACAMFRPAVCAVVLNICSLGNRPSILQLWGRPYLLPENMRRGILGLSRHKESTHTSPSLIVSELRTARFQNCWAAYLASMWRAGL